MKKTKLIPVGMIASSFLLCASFLEQPVLARGGDRLRDSAPVTALILDARDGNEAPLMRAYFDDEIDYFLDIEQPQSSAAKKLVQFARSRAIDSTRLLSASRTTMDGHQRF